MLRQSCRRLFQEIRTRIIWRTEYIVHTLQAAFHCGLNANTPEEDIVKAVNLGCDADMIGAVTGAIVGARFRVTEVPENWIDTIDESLEIRSLADRLVEMTSG